MTPKKKTILIIEDEMDMRFFLKTLVETSGFSALTAKNGREGLRLMAESNPDLIVLDVMMPEQGGARFYYQVQMDQATRGIPVIILSAVPERTFLHYLTMLATQIETTIPQPTAYVEKPPEPHHLLDTILQCLKHDQ